MAARARGIRAVLRERFAQRQFAKFRLVGREHRNIRRRRRDGLAEQPVNDPIATLHRAGAQAGRVLGQEDRHRKQPAARIFLRVVQADPRAVDRLGHSVVPGKNRVDERVVAVQEIEDRAVPLNDVQHKANRLLEHRVAQVAGEAWEPLAVHGVVFLEPANVEPVAGKLCRQMPDVAVLHHPPCLRGEHVGLVQIAGCRVFHQLLVWHARPEEVAQATGQFIVRQRPHVSRWRRAAGQRVDAVAEMRRHQHAGHSVANRLFVTETLIAQ